VERAKPIQIAGVEKLAWAAYQCGEMTTAERWLKRADSDQPTAKWLAAKLLLYDGKLAEAAPLLAQVSRMFPEEEVWKNVERNDFQDGYGDFKPHAEALGECGVLHFARREYTQALRCLLSAGYWTDAAYIAERVLTTDELKSYVDCSCPATNETQTKIGKTACSEKNESSQFEPQTALRGLLARRLVRMGRRAEAKVYFSNDLQNRLAFYAQALQEGNDANKSRADRADALWRAALIARYDGLELLGTELAPDWAVYDGDYDLGTLAETVWPVKEEPQRLFHLDPELQRRLSRHVPKPEKRFHYRHVACDHAWAATALLPDQADETARRLCLAGSWIKDREPKSADRFYKALIRRCSTTTLGQTAETLRWFPKMDDKNSTPEDDDRRITQHKSLPGLNLK
jgi:tetratricopeptide (TPR) repeat protein